MTYNLDVLSVDTWKSADTFSADITSGKAKRNYYLQNELGSPTKLIDEAGKVKASFSYDAFGKPLAETYLSELKASYNIFSYTGYQFDETSGLMYAQARYYMPEVGRFISEDAYKGEIVEPQSLNLYVYCNGNPVNFVDPSGYEYIVVSGGKYSNDSKDFKYNFIEPAIKELRELRKENSKEKITWVISTAGWSETNRRDFMYVAKKIKVDIMFINYASDLTEYINLEHNKSNDDKITKFFVFSHGLLGSIELGYSQDDAEYYTLDKEDIEGIDPNAFDNPYSYFYSCRTGTDVCDKDTSFAQEWVNKVGGTTEAIVGRSWYGDMNKGESLKNKIYRKIYGFSIYGSAGYPVPYKKQNAYWKTFEPQ